MVPSEISPRETWISVRRNVDKAVAKRTRSERLSALRAVCGTSVVDVLSLWNCGVAMFWRPRSSGLDAWLARSTRGES